MLAPGSSNKRALGVCTDRSIGWVNRGGSCRWSASLKRIVPAAVVVALHIEVAVDAVADLQLQPPDSLSALRSITVAW
jgi:hypothetical protein